MPDRTTLGLDGEAVSTLLGLVRFGLDEAEEHLGGMVGTDTMASSEEFVWWQGRAETLLALAGRLEAAAERLGLEVRSA